MRLFKDESGIAMTEGVIVLPVFIILLIGYPILHNGYIRKLDAQAEASDKALADAGNSVCGPSTSFDELDDESESGFSAGEVSGFSDNKFVNVFGSAIPLIPQRASVKVEKEIKGWGESTISVTGSRVMTCNSKVARHPFEVIGNLLGSIIDLFRG